MPVNKRQLKDYGTYYGIVLKHGEMLINKEDYEKIQDFCLFSQIDNLNSGLTYAHISKRVKGKPRLRYRVHRFILCLTKQDTITVDHRNGNGLDNRRINLRRATISQNTVNQVKRSGCSSQFIGVHKHINVHGTRWYTTIRVNKEKRWLGSFDSEIEAAKAYDEKAKELFGEFARLNFPEQNKE